MDRPAFRLELPDVLSTAVVVASPHSGRHYPWDFMQSTVLDERAIRSSEDAYVDMLVAEAPSLGAPLLVAEFPRAFVDLNRASDELDPAVIEAVGKSNNNPRVSSGLGVIPRVVANGRHIYRGKLSRAEADRRLDHVWRPYHSTLETLLTQAQAQFGEAILLDMHSMPHEALEAVTRQGTRRPDVVLGDCFGASARSDLVDLLEDVFVEAGLVVSRNAPFAGAFVAQHYGRPSRNRHAVQIELDRSLYMNEGMIRPNSNFHEVKSLITRILAQVIDASSGRMPLAAE